MHIIVINYQLPTLLGNWEFWYLHFGAWWYSSKVIKSGGLMPKSIIQGN